MPGGPHRHGPVGRGATSTVNQATAAILRQVPDQTSGFLVASALILAQDWLNTARLHGDDGLSTGQVDMELCDSLAPISNHNLS